MTGVILLSVQPAQADDCGGNVIYRDKAFYNGNAVGELVVYYNASTGNNCARFDHVGAAYGVTAYTEVTLYKCSATQPGNGCGTTLDADSNSGYFQYYAGPVRVQAPHNCVRADGFIYWHGAYRVADTGGDIGC
ncbi:MAG: hypothetical protein ACJ74O_17555 [Frankiaceae bacterium]